MGFLAVTFRRFAKEKFYALVCIISLALGIAGSSLISLFLLSELTFDQYHQNHDRIYRVNTRFGEIEISNSGYDIGPTLIRDNPQFLDYVRFRPAIESEFTYEDNTESWDSVFLSDSSVFDIFTILPVRGDLGSAFPDPFSIAISESFAEFYFGSTDPIGRTLTTEEHQFRVSLVFEDAPENVSQRYDALLPFGLLEIYQPEYLENFGDRYIAPSNTTYLHVANNFNPQSMKAASDYLFDTYMGTGWQGAVGGPVEIDFELKLQNLGELHFGKKLISDDSTGNIVNLYIFMAVAIILLAISCINYVNLATARAAVRSKEVAMKKILGASSENLIFQFLAESLFFVMLAFIVGILFAIAAIELGAIEELTGKTELGDLLLSPGRFLMFIAAGLLIGLVSGIYPALTLSRPSMMSVLKPEQTNTRRGLSIRQILVFLQMTASVIIVACVFIMLRQSDFLVDAPMGFKKDNQLVVKLRGAETIRSRQAIITELNRYNEILSVVEMQTALGTGLSISMQQVEKNDGLTESLTMNPFTVGDGFLETLEVKLLQGKMFLNEQAGNDVTPVLVNETLVDQMNWDQAIGKKVGGREVVGVIEDFHYRPLHEPIAPSYIAPYSDGYLETLPEERLKNASVDLIISVSGNKTVATREYIEETVDQFSDQVLIEVVTLDAVWARMYEDESRTIALVGVFAGLSIAVSLLGVAGLASYNTQQRGKEVAIRKVLGASVPNILVLLSMNMMKVIAIAILPAVAAAYYFSNIWLERFSYKAEFSSLPFLLAIGIVSIFSLSVLLMQSYRASRLNPVTKLKYE